MFATVGKDGLLAGREEYKPMGKTREYQGYTIQSAPQCLADGVKWQLHIFVSVDNLRGVKAREFSVDVWYEDGAGG